MQMFWEPVTSDSCSASLGMSVPPSPVPTFEAATHERLDEAHPEASVLEIAHHLTQASPLVEARTLVSFVERAGHQALSRFAWQEAARYYEAALNAMGTPIPLGPRCTSRRDWLMTAIRMWGLL